ncbi:MAG: molecular chaperone HtpG [Planctomycetes bacterium]|nr:molecular chaperone HtpG [Planctomycetota bacterium]
MTATVSAPERREFKTELKQLLDLIVHSLYTKKEIFLRELISNAADAIDRARYEALTKPDLLGGDSDWKIRLIPDEKAGTLTVSDNGIGMAQDAIVENLGTIARSGTREFLERLRQAEAKDRPEMIGRFGVGFYASFMVADRVTVLSRPAGGGPADAVRWESDGQGEYTLEPAERATRGTDVILHLRDDAKEFLAGWRLREIVKHYSDFIEHPVVTEVEKETEGKKRTEEETLNSRQAIWLRAKAEIKEEEYQEFYRQVSKDHEDPLKTIHMVAEGTMEFRALVYLPTRKPFDFYWREPKAGLHLYVRRVLIMHECDELLPGWLRFVKGVVDSSDLPLNVSRELLQHNPVLARIRTALVTKVLKTLEELKTSEPESYLKFFREFGSVLKEGVSQDPANRERLAELLLVETTKQEAGKPTTLAEVLGRMPAEAKELPYLIGETRAQIEHSPYLEGHRARGEEVLLLTDPIDEFVMESLGEYKGKTLTAADRATSAGDEAAAEAAKKQAEAEGYTALLGHLAAKLPEVKEVRLTGRLTESAACLVADGGAMSAYMERLMQRLGRAGEAPPPAKRALELNPSHAAVQGLKRMYAANPEDPRIEVVAGLLHDQAVLAEGSKLKDPAGFARRLNDLLGRVVT